MTEKTQTSRYPSLKGKHVFITGGGSGIGAAIVAAFAEQEADVSFVDIATEASEALCESVAANAPVRPVFRLCDIRDIETLQRTIRTLASERGDIDVLVNNAANDDRHKIEDVTPAYWDDRIAINQRPLFFAAQAVLPAMQRRHAGSIINIGSLSWHIAAPGYPVYATSKAAVSGLTRGLARDIGRFNVRINTVTPGWVMTERQMALWVDDAAREEIARNQCLPGELLPEHVANMVLFLASDDSRMCTAQEFIVDGGWS